MNTDFTFKSIDELENISEPFVEQYNKLMSQLTGKESTIPKAALEEVQKRKESELILFMCDSAGEIGGTAQATYVCVPMKPVAYINAVVVDEKFRGQGLGTVLMNELEKRAKERWSALGSFHLTSAPKKGAQSFYLKLGYRMRTKEAGDETVFYLKDI